ncbi:caspase family protein [Streptomyces griseorubiginosus]|uniref:caspase family protein n=1 Tax=Streptomyces griseorubiginosus TaxID=67304 RepID=UPI0036E9C7EB
MAADSAERTAAPEARRFLISTAVTDVRSDPGAERPELADDVRRIDQLFLGELHYVRGADPGLNPTREHLIATLRAFATAPDRRPDDYVVVYIAAHGVVGDGGSHYLLLHDSGRDLRATALRTEDLVSYLWEDTAVERLLVLIDACYAEEGTDSALREALAARASREPVTGYGSTGLVLVASSRRKEEAYPGALSAAFDRAVRGKVAAGHVPPHIRLSDVMAAISDDPQVPVAQRPVWSLARASGDIPAFLPNPHHVPDTAGLKLEEIDRMIALGTRERGLRDQDMRGFFLPRARGTDLPTDEVWDFTGRHAALADLTSWLSPRRSGERLCVVTGDPGSGKSSLLGMVAVLTDPERGASVPRAGLPRTLPEPGDVHESVNASHLSTRQVLDALSAAAGCAAESLGALTAHLQTRTSPLVILVDSLDEALAPHETVDELLIPLTDPELQLPLRLLVGTRRHVAARLPEAAESIDLDSERYGDPHAVRAYARKLLCTPGSTLATASPPLVDDIAEAVAEAAGRSFLVARITARTIAREARPPDPRDQRWRDELPRLPGEAMERDLVQRLGARADEARDLLRPLAYAQGAGLPWAGVWARLASALSGRAYTDDDIVWLRKQAGSYVVESVDDGGSVYRVYHRALIEYLRESRDTEKVQRTVTRTLQDVDHPYVRRYLALHASEGGVLDPLVQDARFVLTAAPAQLFAALPGVRTAAGRRAARALSDLESALLASAGDAYDPTARATLRLAAVCRRADALAESCDQGEGELPWRARWAAWNPHEGARRYEGMAAGTAEGVVAPFQYGAFFVEVSEREGVRRWDLEEGTWSRVHHDPGTPHRSTLTAPAQLPGTAAALTHDMRLAFESARSTRLAFSRTRVLTFWDHRRRRWLLPPTGLVDHESGQSSRGNRWENSVRSEPRIAEQLVLLADSKEEPTAAALRFRDGHLIVYRLEDAPAYPKLTVRQRRAVWESDIKDWEARADQSTATVWQSVQPRMTTRITTCAAPQGLRPLSLLLGRADGSVVEFAVDTGASGAEVRTGHEGPVTHVDLITGHPQGRLLVTAGQDRTVRVSSLTGGGSVRTLLTSTSAVASFAVRRVGRQWIVAAATVDGRLHRIDLDSGRPIGLPRRVDRGTSVRVSAFPLGPIACVSVQGNTRGVQLFDLVTGDQVGGQVANHAATALGVVTGTVCVGGSDGVIRLWPTTHVADSVPITAHEGPVLALGGIRGPAGSTALLSVGADYEIRCWGPAGSEELWRRTFLDPGRLQAPLVGCVTIGRTADGRDFVATGEYGGRVGVLLLRDGLPVAEQEFTTSDTVTALTAGRLRDRDVVVVGTASGRLSCWDVGAGRMLARGLPPDEPVWTSALALAPDGSGRVAVGGFDGTVREWSLPTGRPLGPARAAHRGRVCALTYYAGELVGCGSDHRLVTYADGWEHRMPHPVGSFLATDEGLLCGDESGQVWRLRHTGTGRHVTEAMDTIGLVPAVAAVPLEHGTGVVVGGLGGVLQVRDGQRGTLLRRLRPVGGGDVEELCAVARWPSSVGRVRPLLFTRSDQRLLEYWDFTPGRELRTTGTPLMTPAPHSHYRAELAVVPDEDGAQRLLSLATWNADPARQLSDWSLPPGWPSSSARPDIHLAVHDVARGPLLDQPCRPFGEKGALGVLRAVRCAGRLLVFVPVDNVVVRVLDTTTGQWAELPERDLVDVFTVTVADGDALLVVGAQGTGVYAWSDLKARFARGGERPAPFRPASWRRLRWYRSDPGPSPVHRHPVALPYYRANRAALFPDGRSYAVAGHTDLAVVGVEAGETRCEIELPSRCTALTIGPAGEMIVGTRNGVIVID